MKEMPAAEPTDASAVRTAGRRPWTRPELTVLGATEALTEVGTMDGDDANLFVGS